MLVERPSVCVLANAVDDWLLCHVGGFALCSLEHRGGWPLHKFENWCLNSLRMAQMC